MEEQLKIIISAEIDKLKQELQNGKKQTENFSKDGKKHFEAFSKAASAVGKATAAAMKVTAGAIAAGASALVGLSEATEEYRTNQAKLVTAFETAGASADTAKTAYNDLYRVLGDDGQATEAAAHLAQLTTNEKDLAEWTEICQGVYATFGDSLPIEGLTEAANETAKVGTVTGSLADALNWAGISEDDFNAKLAACNTEAEREELIRSTLNGIYDDAAEAYEKNAKNILEANEAQAKLTESMAQLGEAATPIVTIFKNMGADLLSSIAPSFGLISEGLTDMVNGVEGGAEKLKEGLQGVVDAVLTTLTDMLPSLVEVGMQIIVALVQGITEALPDVIATAAEVIPEVVKTLAENLPLVTEGILNCLPDLLDAVVEIIVSIVDALAEMLPTIIEQIALIIPDIINVLIENIPVLLEAAINFLMAIVDAIPEIIPPLIEALPELVNSLINTLLESIPLLIDAALDLFNAIIEAIPIIIPAIVEALPEIITNIISALIDAIPLLLEGAIKLFMAIVEAIPQIIPPLISALPQIVSTVITNLQEKLQKVFSDIWNGLVQVFGKVKDWFKGKFADAVNAIKSVFSSLGNFFNDIWNKIKGIFSKVGQTIGDAVSNAFSKAVNWVLDKAIGIINGFIDAINKAIGIINEIPGVNVGYLDRLSVPKLAKGGIIDSATLSVIGENGTEAVVPLENNLEWLDKLAGMLNERMGINAPIVMQVDGKTFAEVSVNSINQLTRQTGSLPLKLV